MRKIYFNYSTGYCGMDAAEVVEYPEDVTEEQLNEDAWQGALNNAETYGIYPDEELEGLSEKEILELEESGELDNYTSGIEGCWEEYSPEKHDGTY